MAVGALTLCHIPGTRLPGTARSNPPVDLRKRS